MNRLEKLASIIKNESVSGLSKTAGPRKKTPVSSVKMQKQLDKTKADYKEIRRKLSDLEAQKEKLDADVNSARDGLKKSRTDMLKMIDVLRNMDLVDANSVYFYENDPVDVGYVVDKEEYYLEGDDSGEVTLTPMKKYRKSKKIDDSDVDLIPGVEDLEEHDDESCTDDQCVQHSPNFRFGD